MAAKTADSIQKHNFGSMTLYIATFSSEDATHGIDDGDTWASGIPYPIAYWGNLTDDPTAQTNNQVNVTLSTAATGAFTLQTGENNRTGVIYVLTKSMT